MGIVGEGICGLPAHRLAARIARRELSAVEALEAYLERITAYNPALNAVVSLDAEQARQQAEAVDAALARGEVLGPLHGVPMTLKDGHDVAGLRTTAGTAVLDRVPERDGTVAARLRRAGAVIVGHTNVPPWLGDHQSANPIFGRTANPWDPERTPGGSSGGAAAALAAGLTPLEVGSDLVGSIRLPAHFCGVYGLKPTEHRVPATGFLRPPPGMPRTVRILGCIGPMARDLDDLALAMDIIAGPDGHDGDVPAVPLAAPPARPLPALRLAVAPTLPGATVARDVRAQVERVAGAASAAGARVEERLPDVDLEPMYRLYGQLVATLTQLFEPTAELPAEHRTLPWYLEALERRDRYVAAWEAFFDHVDALVLPPAMTAAFPHCEPGSDLDVDGQPARYTGHGRLVGPANLTGQPALTVPAGRDAAGLPIGVQLTGPRWSEPTLLAIAQEFEHIGVLPGFQPPPVYR